MRLIKKKDFMKLPVRIDELCELKEEVDGELLKRSGEYNTMLYDFDPEYFDYVLAKEYVYIRLPDHYGPINKD